MARMHPTTGLCCEHIQIAAARTNLCCEQQIFPQHTRFNATAHLLGAHTIVRLCVCVCDAAPIFFFALILTAARRNFLLRRTVVWSLSQLTVSCTERTIWWMRTRRTADGNWMQVDNFFFFFFLLFFRWFFFCVPFHLDVASLAVVFVIVWHSARRPIVSTTVTSVVGGGDGGYALFLTEWRCDINAVMHLARAYTPNIMAACLCIGERRTNDASV